MTRKKKITIIISAAVACILGVLVLIGLKYNLFERARIEIQYHFKGVAVIDTGSYVGDIDAGIFNGNGTFTFNTGEVYNGEIENNVINGNGKMTYPNIGKYTGDFIASKREGSGTFSGENGDTYTGKWNQDKLCGKGVYTYSNGAVLEGEFKDNAFINGKCTFEDGSTLSGTFTNGVITNGTYITTKKDIKYTYKIDEEKCTVSVEYKNGVKYDGEFENGTFNGSGTMTYKNGDKYSGTFKNGKKDDTGTYTWKDGGSYTGKWENDKMNGYGVYYYTSDITGDRLSGTFEDNVPVGTCSYYSSKLSKSYSTEWENGKCKKVLE